MLSDIRGSDLQKWGGGARSWERVGDVFDGDKTLVWGEERALQIDAGTAECH